MKTVLYLAVLLLVTLQVDHQASAQLYDGQDTTCDSPLSLSGRPAELDPRIFLDSDHPKMKQCIRCFCIDGQVEVRYQWKSYICDEPTSDKEWVRCVEQAPERQDGFD